MFRELESWLVRLVHERRRAAHLVVLVLPMIGVLMVGGALLVFAPVSQTHSQHGIGGQATTPVAAQPLNTNTLLDSANSTQPTPKPSTTTTTASSGNTTVNTATATTSPAPTPNPKPTPTPSPAAHATVSISLNGCHVTATGTPGLYFTVGVFGGGHGGQTVYRIPASGSISEADGGIKYETAFGEVDDANGTQIARLTAPITVKQCTAGDPGIN